MSKLYEALQQPVGPQVQIAAVEKRASAPRLALASRRDMEALYQSLEAVLPAGTGKVVLFTASRANEGTTTIVREFAATLVNILGAAVLVVDADPNHGAAGSFGVSPVRLADLIDAFPVKSGAAKQPGITVAAWDIGTLNALSSGDGVATLARSDALRAHFDYTIFDVPAIGDYPAATSIGRYVDGVVIVVEAERTRWPVVAYTRRAYETVGAKVLGIILNKRRFYIPNKIYRWL
jgi:Mrp family chromosome partitioning ATPase